MALMVTLHGFTGSTDSWRLVSEQLELSWLHLPLLGHDSSVPPGSSTSFAAEAPISIPQ